jgi:hypothetical protein
VGNAWNVVDVCRVNTDYQGFIVGGIRLREMKAAILSNLAFLLMAGSKPLIKIGGENI